MGGCQLELGSEANQQVGEEDLERWLVGSTDGEGVRKLQLVFCFSTRNVCFWGM